MHELHHKQQIWWWLMDFSHSVWKMNLHQWWTKLHEFHIWNFLRMTSDQWSFLKDKWWFQKFGIFSKNYFKIIWICSKKIKKFLKICHWVAKLCHNKKQLLWPMSSISANYQDSSTHVPIYCPKQFCKPRASKKQPSTMPIHPITSNLMWTFWATVNNPLHIPKFFQKSSGF